VFKVKSSFKKIKLIPYILAFSFVGSAIAAPTNSNARYIVSLGGINIATVKIDLNDDGNNFDISLGADISGVGSLVASGSAFAKIKGKSNGVKLAPKNMNISTKAKNKDFSVSVQYVGSNASGFQVEPAIINNIGRVPLERKDLVGVSDPIASFILKAKKLDAQLCKKNLKVFTGLERFNIKMKYAKTENATSSRTGYQGPVVLCTMQYVPVSGHYVSSGMTKYLAKSKRMLIWYAPLKETDYYIPYRVLIGTSAGDLSMVLTGLK